MIANIKDIIILDDNNKYAIVSKTNYKSKMYYYLIDTGNPSNVKFCYEEDNKLVEVDDNDLILKLLPALLAAVKDEVDNIFNG